jgi:hypothetical protein
MTRQPAERWTMAQVRDFLGQGPAVAIHPAPVTATDPDGTRVMQATPSEPVAVPPVVVDPGAAGHVAPDAEERRPGRRSLWPWVAAAAVVLALTVITGAVLVGAREGSSPSATPPSSGHSSTPGPSSSSSADAQAAAMSSFITNYLSTATSDQHASWAMLTTGFQKESGGFGRYQGFWRTISSATARDITPDPAALTVTYGVDYLRTDGSTATDQVTLKLVRNGASYLINGEA